VNDELVSSLARVFQEIIDERGRQNNRYGLDHDDQLLAAGWGVVLAKHVGRVAESALDSDPLAFRRSLVRVAAVAVAAVEAFDRAAG
jgi:hypothetical protein